MFEITSLPPVPFLALQDGKGHLCCVHVLLNNDLGLCLLLPTPQHTYVHHPCKGSPCPPTRIYAGLVSVQEGVSLSSCLGSGLRIQLCCLPSQGHPCSCWAPFPCPVPQSSRRGALSPVQPRVPSFLTYPTPPTHTFIHTLMHLCTHSHTFTLLLNSSLISTVLQFNSDTTQSEHRPHKLKGRFLQRKTTLNCRCQTQMGSPGSSHF